MDDFWRALTDGLIVVCLIGLCSSVGYILKTIDRLLQAQKFILDRLHQGTIQTIPVPNWRELPPDGQLMMRQALRQVLAEMDAELPTRH